MINDPFDDYIREQVLEKTSHIFPETKAEIVEYYQDHYEGLGKDGWKQHLIRDLLPFTPQTGKNPAKNLSRRFDPSRLDTQPRKGSKQEEEFRELGKTLEPEIEIPDNGYHVTFIGEFLISGKCEERSFEVDVIGDEAAELAETGDQNILFTLYFAESGQENLSEGVCGSPQITVEPL